MDQQCLGGSSTDDEESMEVVALSGVNTVIPTNYARRPRQMYGESRGDATRRRPRRRRKTRHIGFTITAHALLISGIPMAMTETCISLANSRTCPSFNASSISTDSTLVGFFPFLSSVTSLSTFDSGMENYISNGFTQERYQYLIGCSRADTSNTTAFYARYTASVICNAIVQNSITPCGLSGNAIRPLCADSCADYAQSEQEIVASNVCGSSNSNALAQIRADFTNCALPADSLTGSCIAAAQNEPDNCGFSSNLGGLCSYCAASSPNATDSCCVFSNTTTRCTGVKLPIIASGALQPVTLTSTASSSSSTASSSSGAAGAATSRGLTGGQIAGIVVGAVLGALLLLGLLIVGCLLLRRRRDSSPATSVFNQPATTRSQPQMAFNDGARDQERAGLAVLPGGRVARMSALEGSSGSERNPAKYTPGGDYRKSISEEEDTPESARMLGGLAPPPKRSGSLSSGSQLAIAGAEGQDSSPSTDNQYTSPESQGQSEQLAFFKDYYSQDEIRASDLVSTLWAYEPRAADEFHLERGDMIKVTGIWDDGWATGVRVRMNAEDWRPENKTQRDSGLSNGSSASRDVAEGDGEVKAFPLVCVCLPQHWRKTVEGDSTEGTGPGAYPELP